MLTNFFLLRTISSKKFNLTGSSSYTSGMVFKIIFLATLTFRLTLSNVNNRNFYKTLV